MIVKINIGDKMITKKNVPTTENEYREIEIKEILKLGRKILVIFLTLNKITGEKTGNLSILNLSTVCKEYKLIK